MGTDVLKIEKYILAQYVHADKAAQITLILENKSKAVINFLKQEDDLPLGDKVSLGYWVSFPYSQYADILDILRNEKPVYFGYVHEKKRGYIITAEEPVGAEET